MSFTLSDGGMQMTGITVLGPTPGAPAITSVTQTGIGAVTINYTKPAHTGASFITKYTAVSSPSDITGTVSTMNSGSIVVSGLTEYQSYTFKVYPTNSFGDGIYSTPSNSILIYPATPDAPAITSVSQTNAGEVTVSFTAPARVGLSSITSYTATILGGSQSGSTVKVNGSGSGSLKFTSLTNNTTYNFTIHATNSFGDGTESNSSSDITVAQGQAAWEGSTGVTLNTTWTVPAGVTSISAVVIGGGGGRGYNNTTYPPGGGGGGGGLSYVNNLSVTPGEVLTIRAGQRGSSAAAGNTGFNGGLSSISRANGTVLISAGGGATQYGTQTGGAAGVGLNGTNAEGKSITGYNGQAGQTATNTVYGQGGGAATYSSTGTVYYQGISYYGSAVSGGYGNAGANQPGSIAPVIGAGAVRIVYPGTFRQYPNTNVSTDI